MFVPQLGIRLLCFSFPQITCPGVMLPSQQDIYLSVRIMDQFQKTHCVPAVFPLLFHKNMVFTKVCPLHRN